MSEKEENVELNANTTPVHTTLLETSIGDTEEGHCPHSVTGTRYKLLQDVMNFLYKCRTNECREKDNKYLCKVIVSVTVNIVLVSIILGTLVYSVTTSPDTRQCKTVLDSVCFSVDDTQCYGGWPVSVQEDGKMHCCSNTAASLVYLVKLIYAEYQRQSIISTVPFFMFLPNKVKDGMLHWRHRKFSLPESSFSSTFKYLQHMITVYTSGTYMLYMTVVMDGTVCRDGLTVNISRQKHGHTSQTQLLSRTQYSMSFHAVRVFDVIKLSADDTLYLKFSDVHCIFLYRPLNSVLIYRIK